MKITCFFVFILLFFLLPFAAFARDNATQKSQARAANAPKNAIQSRLAWEVQSLQNPFVISFYKPNYIMPISYSTDTDQADYSGNDPKAPKLGPFDFAFQFSFKVPIWAPIFGKPSALYIAYTQKSFWQAYRESPFFRETNYEPELFLANYINKDLPFGINWSLLNIGIVHQSNGRGGAQERSWNRIYLAGVFAKNNFMIVVQPWLIIHDPSLSHNPGIGDYLGNGSVLIAYKWHNAGTLSLQLRNNFLSGFRHGAETLSWSFPILKHLRVYAQFFSGYGQSLIEYDHYTNSFGVGIALNDWL